jgi:MSHA biogenesis protein MshQ
MKVQRQDSSYLIVCLLWVLSIFSPFASGVTEQVRVSANNDDAEERVSNGDMSRSSTDLELGFDGNNQQIVGMRFRGVDIPQGATINSAYIEFETDETDSGTTSLVIFGEDGDSPNQFENNDNNISDDRTKTSASMNWVPSAWNSVNELHQTPDISSIIQEIVDRGGWVANNNLVIIIEPGSGCSTSSCQRTAESHNGESGAAPLLVVDYTLGSSGTSLTGSLNVDNTFIAYISTDDSVQGTLIGSGNNWPTTVDIATSLTVGQDYYLHIYATDVGGVAGFLGDFELTGTDHVFSNGLTTLNTNTSNWSVSTSGWNNYQAASGYGLNGVSPWGTRSGVDSSAEWIWSSDSNGDNINYFSTKISASVPLVLQNISGSCLVLQEVTMTFNTDVEQTSAETVSNYQLTNPSGVDISINSAIRGPSNTVTLLLATTLNDLTEYTVTVNNVQAVSGDIIPAGSTSSFSLSCNLNCITDQFSGPGGLSSSWSASSSNGSFGTPRIVDNGRLRLTDNSGQVATVATLLNQFPGAGNKIEIEFDYYGYGGSGADGIAVTFSDAAIPPVPGSYGGALGYAQRSGGTPGFAGGWLGIGIDEYGNFANSNEGKSGGSGFEKDSVALRGSGSGTTGYPYLTSTGTLSPGIDESGSTANPGHRYRVSIDHTMGGLEAYVTVDRDTGSGFVELIPQFDIYTINPSQAAVPTNWIVSFTGSTGGSTNIHEIGEFEVCAALPIAPYGSPDHYKISHSSQGVTCEGAQITVTAHDASHAEFPVSSDTVLTVTTTPAVDSIISSPVTMLADTSFVNFHLNQSVALANIDIDVTDGTASDLDDGGDEDEPFEFLDTLFRFYADLANTDDTAIGTQISGKPSNVTPGNQSLALRAVRTNTDTGACEAALLGTTAVELAYECNNPDTCTTSNLLSITSEILAGDETTTISRNDDGTSLGYIDVDMEFNASGEAPFYMNYFDAGQITLHAKKSVAANSPEPAFELLGQSNAFVVTPFAFHFVVENEPTATSGLGDDFRVAGADFDVTLRPVVYEKGDDENVNNDLANNALTPNFGRHNVIDLVLDFDLQAPTGLGTSSGALTGWANPSTAFNNSSTLGERLFENLTWSEVGIISLNALHSNYLGGGLAIDGARPNIGRFYPDHFDVTVDVGRFAASCVNLAVTEPDFTYIGQYFTYDDVPNLTITAKNSIGLGGTTVNYTHADFIKLGTSNISRVFPNSDTLPGPSGPTLAVETSLLAGAGESMSVLSAGVMNYLFDEADLYRYTKNANAEIGPFDSTLSVAINNFQDLDGAANSSLIPAVVPLAPNGSANDSNLYGRFVMQNAFGPETENLAMNAYAEFLNASGQYVLNTADNCTNLSSTISMMPAGTTGADNHETIPVGTGTGTSDFSYASPLSGGNAGFLFTAPGSGNFGEIDVNIDLLTFPWLQYNWNGNVAGSLQNPPSTTAMFGQYRGHDRIIYWREVQ